MSLAREFRASRSQRGVALIMAVLIVALATILAIDVGFKAYLDQRRAATSFALEQAFEVAKGAEAWAADILKDDLSSGSKRDDLTERWATPIPPLPIDGGEVEGQLLDLQGRFNLNTLVQNDRTNGQVQINKYAYEQFVRLLRSLELEEHWAAKIVDWIDPDDNPMQDGGEDNVYTTQTPPYRAPNMWITRVSELLALPQFGIERYRRLAPHVSALPPSVTQINVCTASGPVLDSLYATQQNWARSPQSLTEGRRNGCFPEKQTIDNELRSEYDSDQAALNYYRGTLSEQSNYFEADVWVTIGTTQFSLYSLLYRNPQTKAVGPTLRSFGTR